MPGNSEHYFRNVRRAVAEWKHSQLQNSVKDDQDTTKLNDFLRKTAIIYHSLKDYLDSNDTLSEESLSGILNAIGDKRKLSYEDRMILLDYLLHDLMEYPFTYNTSLINSFQPTNILNTKIVPNK
jgi:hypothetical protein